MVCEIYALWLQKVWLLFQLPNLLLASVLYFDVITFKKMFWKDNDLSIRSSLIATLKAANPILEKKLLQEALAMLKWAVCIILSGLQTKATL